MSSAFGGGGEKEARRQEDIARQKEEVQQIVNSFLAQLVPGSDEYNQLASEGNRLVLTSSSPLDEQSLARELGQRLVGQQQARIAGGGPATALEARTQKAFEGIRGAAAFSPEEQAVFQALRGLGLSGEQEASGKIFQDLVARAQDPNQFYKSFLDEKLAMAESAVKARAAQRGILGSGLELEDLGLAGGELAIQANAEQERFRQNQLNNFMNLFNVGQQLRGREIGVEEAFTNMMLGRESNLTGLLAAQTGRNTADTINLLMRQTGRAEGLRDLAEAQGSQNRGILGSAIGKIVAPLLGKAASFIPGIGPILGPAISGAGGILASQQAQQGQQQPMLSSSLSRQAQGGLELNELVRLLSRRN